MKLSWFNTSMGTRK